MSLSPRPKYTPALRGRRVLITGAARGIGAGLADLLTSHGARVALMGLEPDLLAELQSELGLTYLFIAHDLGVVRFLSQRTVVLYRGQVMETGPVEAVSSAPRHPYTVALTAAAPVRLPVRVWSIHNLPRSTVNSMSCTSAACVSRRRPASSSSACT